MIGSRRRGGFSETARSWPGSDVRFWRTWPWSPRRAGGPGVVRRLSGQDESRLGGGGFRA